MHKSTLIILFPWQNMHKSSPYSYFHGKICLIRNSTPNFIARYTYKDIDIHPSTFHSQIKIRRAASLIKS